MNTARFVLLLLMFSAFFGSPSAQTETKEDDEPIRVDTQLVDVPFIVTDKTGKPILNLKQNNFVIYEDGKRQEIAEFAATSAPFEVALLLDTSGSTRSDLALIQRAAANFIGNLRPGDRVSIVSYKTAQDDVSKFPAVEILNDLTDDRERLKTALESVKTSNGTPYYDSLLQVAERVFAKAPAGEFRGRRALVALTDGVDSVSAAEFDEVKEVLAKAGITCYFIQINTRDVFEDDLLRPCPAGTRFSTAQIRRYYRVYYPRSNVEKTFNFCGLGDFERLAISKGLYELAEAQMKSLADASGGRVFPVADLTEVRNAFKSVADEIGTKYSLGYYSTNEKRDGTYRKIKVELKSVPAGSQIRSREGYTAPTN